MIPQIFGLIRLVVVDLIGSAICLMINTILDVKGYQIKGAHALKARPRCSGSDGHILLR